MPNALRRPFVASCSVGRGVCPRKLPACRPESARPRSGGGQAQDGGEGRPWGGWKWMWVQGRMALVPGSSRMTWGHLCKVSLDSGCPWDPFAASHHVSRRRWWWSWAACTAWWGACWCSASFSNLIKSFCRPSSGVLESTVKQYRALRSKFVGKFPLKLTIVRT